MLAIAQSGSTYHYLNWVPSEWGPLVTHHGSIQKAVNDIHHNDQYFFDILEEIFSQVNNGEPICTFSLDRNYVLFSSCFCEDMNQDLIDWHFKQSMDDHLSAMMDYYHYPMESSSHSILNIGIPKNIRQSFLANMRLLKSRLNSLSVGIFSAESGARKWMQAEKNANYVIWKIGKKKMDELLFIRNGELATYFSFHRKGNNGKIMWHFGDADVADLIVQDIVNIQNGKIKKFNSTEKVYLYTSESSVKDVKYFHQMGIKNLILLNPLSVLKTSENGQYHEYNTLPLAETGNAFGGIDV